MPESTLATADGALPQEFMITNLIKLIIRIVRGQKTKSPVVLMNFSTMPSIPGATYLRLLIIS